MLAAWPPFAGCVDPGRSVPAALAAGLELKDRPAARHRRWDQPAERTRVYSRVQKSVPHEGDEIIEFLWRQRIRMPYGRVEQLDRHPRSEPENVIDRETRGRRIVCSRFGDDVHVKTDRIVEPRVRPVMKAVSYTHLRAHETPEHL